MELTYLRFSYCNNYIVFISLMLPVTFFVIFGKLSCKPASRCPLQYIKMTNTFILQVAYKMLFTAGISWDLKRASSMALVTYKESSGQYRYSSNVAVTFILRAVFSTSAYNVYIQCYVSISM